jgi:hypothetical protein
MSALPIPIVFAPGSYGAIVNNIVATEVTASQAYTINAQKGQLLTLIFGGGASNGDGGYDLQSMVTDPNGNGIPPDGNPVAFGTTLQLPLDGTYTIYVGISPMGNPWTGTLTLCALVVNPPPII